MSTINSGAYGGECTTHGPFILDDRKILAYIPDTEEKESNREFLHGGIILLVKCSFHNCGKVYSKVPHSSVFSIPVVAWSSSPKTEAETEDQKGSSGTSG